MKNRKLKEKPFFQKYEGETLFACALIIVGLIYLIYFEFK